jgi:DNA adenine methylase Dam
MIENIPTAGMLLRSSALSLLGRVCSRSMAARRPLLRVSHAAAMQPTAPFPLFPSSAAAALERPVDVDTARPTGHRVPPKSGSTYVDAHPTPPAHTLAPRLPDGVDVRQGDGLALLESIPDGSIDLVLTDPPYLISKDSNLNCQFNHVAARRADGTNTRTAAETRSYFDQRTDSEWAEYLVQKGVGQSKHMATMERWKRNFEKFGTIYGTGFGIRTSYGAWDTEDNFTMNDLNRFVVDYYRVLRKGGKAIIWFDLWKTSHLAEMMTEAGFKQLRMLYWEKANPPPLNSSRNYLSNAREVAVVGVKHGKGTFHSKYDKGVYTFPIAGGKDRFHPTQKPLALFEALVEKHSSPGDCILDTFLGSGTTAVAVARLNQGAIDDDDGDGDDESHPARTFIGCEQDEVYFEKLQARLVAEEERGTRASKENAPIVGHLKHVARSSSTTRPLLRWAGQKPQMIGSLMQCLPLEAGAYHEPFVGGGGVLFAVLEGRVPGPNKAAFLRYDRFYASDINPHLINMYEQVQQHPSLLIEELEYLAATFAACPNIIFSSRTPRSYAPPTLEEATTSKHNFYYWVRACFNAGLSTTTSDEQLLGEHAATQSQRAAQFLFLTKMCLGTYREGGPGSSAFNGSFRKSDFARIAQRDKESTSAPFLQVFRKGEIMRVSSLIQPVTFRCLGIQDALCDVTEGDVVYLDPPHTHTNTPIQSQNDTVNKLVQTDELLGMCDRLDSMGGRFLLSSPDTAGVLEFCSNRRRYVSNWVGARPGGKLGSKKQRGEVEIVAHNYEVCVT